MRRVRYKQSTDDRTQEEYQSHIKQKVVRQDGITITILEPAEACKVYRDDDERRPVPVSFTKRLERHNIAQNKY